MGQKEIQNVQLGEGKNSGKLGVAGKTCAGRKDVRMLSRKGLIQDVQDNLWRMLEISIRVWGASCGLVLQIAYRRPGY